MKGEEEDRLDRSKVGRREGLTEGRMTVQSTALKAVLAALAVCLKLGHLGAQSLPRGVELHLGGSSLVALRASIAASSKLLPDPRRTRSSGISKEAHISSARTMIVQSYSFRTVRNWRSEFRLGDRAIV